jgi:hypothetical protein
MDTYDLLAGETWEVAIEKALEISDFIVIFLSHKSVTKRGYVQKELKHALQRYDEQLESDIFIVPIKLKQVAQLQREADGRDWPRLA